jgi:recombinational DNA repair ATPase RecF
MSAGQRNSIIFAFILAIVETATQQREAEQQEDNDYPLVMDAPFSSLDDDRRMKIGKLLDRVIDQIIIFDYEPEDKKVFEGYIGKSYRLVKEKGNETRTYVVEVVE